MDGGVEYFITATYKLFIGQLLLNKNYYGIPTMMPMDSSNGLLMQRERYFRFLK